MILALVPNKPFRVSTINFKPVIIFISVPFPYRLYIHFIMLRANNEDRVTIMNWLWTKCMIVS